MSAEVEASTLPAGALPALDFLRGYIAAAERSAPIADPQVWDWLAALADEVEQQRDLIGTLRLPALTPSHIKVYHYLRNAPTMTVAEIADEMFLSLNTIKSHTKAIFHRLGVRHRRELQRYPRRWTRTDLKV